MRTPLIAGFVSAVVSMHAAAVTEVGSIGLGNSPFALALNADSTQAVVVNLVPGARRMGPTGPMSASWIWYRCVRSVPSRRELAWFPSP